MLRICHAPTEIAGQVGLICKKLKELGVHANGYNFFPSYFNYKGTYVTDAFELQKVVNVASDYFDIFHFHNSSTFISDCRDLEWIQQSGKKSIMHHRGVDVRMSHLARKGADYDNPYVNTESSYPDETIIENLTFFFEIYRCSDRTGF